MWFVCRIVLSLREKPQFRRFPVSHFVEWKYDWSWNWSFIGRTVKLHEFDLVIELHCKLPMILWLSSSLHKIIFSQFLASLFVKLVRCGLSAYQWGQICTNPTESRADYKYKLQTLMKFPNLNNNKKIDEHHCRNVGKSGVEKQPHLLITTIKKNIPPNRRWRHSTFFDVLGLKVHETIVLGMELTSTQ